MYFNLYICRDHFDGQIRKWHDLSTILHDGEREIVEVEGNRYKIVECIQRI